MKSTSATEIYLDANATTPVLPQAAEAAYAAMQQLYGNPSSSHITGLRARHLLESARDLARRALGAPTGRIVFTSGATEAIETAVFSTLCAVRQHRSCAATDVPRVLLYSATEHKAVPQALKHWNELLGFGAEVLAIPVDGNGQLDLEFLREHARAADIVCTMAVNNETGVIHDLREIESVLRQQNSSVAWLVDCVQALAKIDLGLASTTIDYAPISGHKLYAPKGIGMLYVREGAPLIPLLAGGGQEGGARGGTENLPGVAALAAVLRFLVEPGHRVFQPPATLERFRERLVRSLQNAFPDIVFNAPFEHSVPTTINFAIPGIASKELLDLFDAAGVRVSSGSACGSALQGSYVLEAMGLPRWQSDGAIRLSFGPTTLESEVDRACCRIEETGRALRESSLIINHGSPAASGVPLEGLLQLKKGSVCTWLLANAQTRKCVVIDPSAELAERVESLVCGQHWEVLAILDTHSRMPHESSRALLLHILGLHTASFCHTPDDLGWPVADESRRWAGQASPGDVKLSTCVLGDGSIAEYLAISDGEVLAMTPLAGHTNDGRAYLLGKLTDDGRLPPDNVRMAFCGDTIQIGGLGRSDRSTSSPANLYESLRRLSQLLSDTTIICPTHDYVNGFVTTLAAEKTCNELLARVLDPNHPLDQEAFLSQKQELDARIPDDDQGELRCGHIAPPAVSKSAMNIRPDALRSFLADHPNWTVIDVRESHESCFALSWESLGLRHPPLNVPLTGLAQFLARLLHECSDAQPRDLVFICRSGNRSGRAAEVARRLGLASASHVAGGIALGVPPHVEARQSAEEELEYLI